MTEQPRGELPYSFGPYTLIGLLGEGGMARVYRAVREGPMGFRKELAVKLIHVGDSARSRDLARHLINEARLGGQLRHPNVVDTYEFGTVGDDHYIAMEMVNGLTLQTLLSGLRQRGGRLPVAAILDLAVQICQGLEYAHNLSDHDGKPLNLIHRDLKPSNIIVTMAGQAKIMDFGIARASTALFTATASDVSKGTLRYMSPEQLNEPGILDQRSDLFALGVILFECVTDTPLLEGETTEALMWDLVSGRYRERLSLVDDVLPEIRPILDSCLHMERDHRHAHAGLLREDLADLQHDLGEGLGCHELMLLLVAHARGEFQEFDRLRTKTLERLERVGKDSGWAAVIERLDTARGESQNLLVSSILHTEGALAGPASDAGPTTELGETTVVWQAPDATGGETPTPGEPSTVEEPARSNYWSAQLVTTLDHYFGASDYPSLYGTDEDVTRRVDAAAVIPKADAGWGPLFVAHSVWDDLNYFQGTLDLRQALLDAGYPGNQLTLVPVSRAECTPPTDPGAPPQMLDTLQCGGHDDLFDIEDWYEDDPADGGDLDGDGEPDYDPHTSFCTMMRFMEQWLPAVSRADRSFAP